MHEIAWKEAMHAEGFIIQENGLEIDKVSMVYLWYDTLQHKWQQHVRGKNVLVGVCLIATFIHRRMGSAKYGSALQRIYLNS